MIFSLVAYTTILLLNVNYGDIEAARTTINKWVETQTKDKIVNLLQPGTIDPLTRLVLVNAVYFRVSHLDLICLFFFLKDHDLDAW